MARTWLDYAGIAQAQEFAQAQQQRDMLAFQQAQQDRQRQQAAQAAAGNALPQLVQPPPQAMQQPAPQPPAPGQVSQPMQQAGGGVPLPQGPVPGQGLRPPLPPGGAQGAMPPQGVPPFRPMPTTPPQAQAAPQGAIPAPPGQAAASPANPQQDQMEGGFSLSNIIQSGQKQGLSGTDLYDYVQTMEPYMTAQQKAKAEQFKTQLELKKLDAEIALHTQAAQNQNLSRQERERHDQALEDLASRRIGIAQGNLNVRIETAGFNQAGATLPAGTGKIGADGLPAPVGGGGLSPEAVRMLSGRIKGGDASALTGLTRPARTAVQNDLAKLDSTGADIAGNQIDFAAARKGAQSATQREANIATSEKAITNPGGLADQVLDAARKTYRTGSPALNQKINYVLANYGGDPAVVDLKNALGDLEGQFNKAMAGGGTATDAVRAETLARINDAQTLPQLEAAINRMKLGLQKEGEAAQETSKMFADRVRQAGKVGGKPQAQAAPSGPSVGTVESGYRFKGGDPSSPASWERVQ
jgi:hypothetical protein